MRLASALVALAALAPWLAMAPLGGAAAVLADVLALGAALHGAGLLLARLAGRTGVHPLLAIQWGAATLIGLFGLALAAGVAGLAAQAALVYGFAGVHTAALALGFGAYRARVAALRPALRIWLVPAGLLAALAAIHALGAAGDVGAYPFDDDGHVLAQLQRLRQTGALGDPIGYVRGAQLGGQLALQALATLGGGVHLVRLAEALALGLAIGLALVRLRAPGEPDPASGLWALLLAIAAAALTYTRPDPSACWTAIGLILALHATLAELAGDRAGSRASLLPVGVLAGDRAGSRASPLPVGVLAGALIALRFELAPVAAAALAAAWWPRRRSARDTALLAGGALAVVLPYAIARIASWGSIPSAARALVEPWRGPLGVRLAVSAGVALACAPLVILVWREARLRWLAAGAALAIGAIVGQLTGERPYAATFLWPLAIAGGLAAAAEIARHRKLTTAALLASLIAVVFIYEGRTASGRRRWTRRYLALVENIEHLRHTSEASAAGADYAPLLRDVPAGAVVAVWVARPERLDYAAHYRIIDLRTPRAAWMRDLRPYPHAPAIEALLARVRADYLLLEADDRGRVRAARYPAVCAATPAQCLDDLEALALRHPVVAEAGGTRLIDLRGPPPPPPAPPER